VVATGLADADRHQSCRWRPPPASLIEVTVEHRILVHPKPVVGRVLPPPQACEAASTAIARRIKPPCCDDM
jgi:hypothetical protein